MDHYGKSLVIGDGYTSVAFAGVMNGITAAAAWEGIGGCTT